MRLFVAVTLDEALRGAIAAVQEDLRRRQVRGRFTPRENLHLTMAFIGDYPDPEAVLAAMATVPLRPFELRLQGIGAFGELWWIGLADSPALSACARSLRRALAEADVPFDRKRFSPHITLARRVIAGPGGMPGVPVPPAAMTVNHLSLMRSDPGRGGMHYTEIT